MLKEMVSLVKAVEVGNWAYAQDILTEFELSARVLVGPEVIYDEIVRAEIAIRDKSRCDLYGALVALGDIIDTELGKGGLVYFFTRTLVEYARHNYSTDLRLLYGLTLKYEYKALLPQINELEEEIKHGEWAEANSTWYILAEKIDRILEEGGEKGG